MLATATLGMRFLRRCEKCVQDGSAKYFTPGEITVCCVVPFPDLACGIASPDIPGFIDPRHRRSHLSYDWPDLVCRMRSRICDPRSLLILIRDLFDSTFSIKNAAFQMFTSWEATHGLFCVWPQWELRLQNPRFPVIKLDLFLV